MSVASLQLAVLLFARIACVFTAPPSPLLTAKPFPSSSSPTTLPTTSKTSRPTPMPASPPFLSSFPTIHSNPKTPPLAPRLQRALHRAVLERERVFPLVRSFETRLRSHYSASMRLKSELLSDRDRVLDLEQSDNGLVAATPLQDYVTLTRALQREAGRLRASSVDLDRQVENERARAEATCSELRAAFLPFILEPNMTMRSSISVSTSNNTTARHVQQKGTIFLQTSFREKRQEQRKKTLQEQERARIHSDRRRSMLRSPLMTSRVARPPPSVSLGELAPAEDIIRTIRETSQRLFLRARPKRNSTSPPRYHHHPLESALSPDFAPVRAELKWHCTEMPGSLFHAFRMLTVDHGFDSSAVLTSTKKLADQVERLSRVVNTLSGIQADDRLVLRQNLSESARAKAFGTRKQDENALRKWLRREREAEHRRIVSFNPSAPDRCTLTCRRKIRARILSLSRHVTSMQSRRGQHFNHGNVNNMSGYDFDEDNTARTNNHILRESNSTSSSETTSCAVHKSCKLCIADSACGFCEAAGLFGHICTEGVPQGPVFVPCQLGATWHHGLDAETRVCPSSFPQKNSTTRQQYFTSTPTETGAQETDINEKAMVSSAVSETQHTDNVHTSTGNETVPFSPATYNVTRSVGHSPSSSKHGASSSMFVKDFVPFYPGADDVQDNMHWEGQRGAITSLWNALNQPCDGFGWTPSECEVGKRLASKEDLTNAIYDSSVSIRSSGKSRSSSGTIKDSSSTLSSYASSSREESSETILYNAGKRSAGGSQDPIGPEPVPLTINHVFPLENDEGLSGTIDRQGDQAVDASSVLGGGGSGTEDLIISVGSSVDARWNSGCIFEPARVSAVNPDGTFDLLYASGKTELRVDSRSMKTRGVVGSSACRAEGCIVVHGGGCGSGVWPKKVPIDVNKVALPNNLAEKGGKCKTNRDCQSGLLCDPTRICVEINLSSLDPILSKVIDPFGDVRSRGTADKNGDEAQKNRDVTAAIVKSGQGKPGGAGAPPCIPLKGVWPPKCTPTSELPPRILGVNKLGSIARLNPTDPFPHGSFSSPAEEKAVGDLTEAITAAGLGGKVAKAMGEGLKKAAKKDAAGKSQKTSKGEKWRKQVFGPVGTADEGGEHIKPGVGRIAPIGSDPDKKGQSGMEPCKGLPHGLCSFVTTCCWFSAPNFLDSHDHQGECRGVGSCDWSKPPPGSPDPGSGEDGKPGPGLGAFPGKPPAFDPDGAGDASPGPAGKGMSPSGHNADPGLNPGSRGSPTKPGQGEDPKDTAKAVDKLADFVGGLGLSTGKGKSIAKKGSGDFGVDEHVGPLEQLLEQENPESKELIGPSAQTGKLLSSGAPDPETATSSDGMPCRSDSDCALSHIASQKLIYICSEMRVCEKNKDLGSESKGGEGTACGGNSGAECREPFFCNARGKCSAGADIGSVCGHGIDEACRPGLVCETSGKCGAPARLGDACSRDDQCTGLLKCSGAGACVIHGGLNAPCNDANPCSPGLMCEKGNVELFSVCKSQVGSPCQRNEDCSGHALCSTAHSGLQNAVVTGEEKPGVGSSDSGGGSGGGGSGGGSGGASISANAITEMRAEGEVGILEKLEQPHKERVLRFSHGGADRRGDPNVGVDEDDVPSAPPFRQEPIAIDKETGEPYYASAPVPTMLLLDVRQRRAAPTTVFDVGKISRATKCGPTCLANRRQRLCKDLTPFCNWLVTPPSRLMLCATHPVEAIARFAIPARFCNFFVRVARLAHVLVENEGCRFDPRNDPFEVQRACRYLDVQRPQMCKYCEVEREDIHDTDIEIVRILQDLNLDSEPADGNSLDSPVSSLPMKQTDIIGYTPDHIEGSCIINTRLQNASELKVHPIDDECCQCGRLPLHNTLLEMQSDLRQDSEPHLLNKFGDPIRMSNTLGARPQTSKLQTTSDKPILKSTTHDTATQGCCPCVGNNSMKWGDPERRTNVAAVDADISNLSAKYAEESSVNGLRGPMP